jgi:UDP-N-acetylmuramoylalanine--D-glutamate ligase
MLGGRDKDSDFSALLPYLESNVRGVLLVGEAAERIASSLRGHVALDECGTLDAAVDTGLEGAEPGDVLLLAPACTSFDQYADFEQRGRHFRALIAAHAATD